MPGRTVVVIVDLDAGWTVEGERFGSFAGGVYARPVRVRHEGTMRGVQFNLEPPAVRALLGVPAGELGHRTVGLEDLLGPDAGYLAERLHDASGRRGALPGDRRSAHAPARPRWSVPPRPDVARAWTLLRESGGRLRVGAVAEALGCSRRHLADRFAEEVGVSPKVAARLMRFESARARLGEVPLARLAAECGYSDQAHLTREFQALGGASPTQFPFVQENEPAAA